MRLINGIAVDGPKIDSQAVDGLSGVTNSLAYKVAEIERHLHSAGSWFGTAAAPTATHLADRVGPGIDHFTIDAGNDTWGSWVQILGSGDTPARAGLVNYDPHEMLIADAEREVVHFVQFGRGASGDAALSAGTYTEIVIGVDATKKFKGITRIQTGRAPAGSLLWARCLAVGADTGTLNFYIGIHEYEG
jgi:hypothetical protein